MVKKFIDSGYKKLSRFSISTLLVISGSGVAPLLFSSTAHANILGPVNGVYINEFSSYGDEDWIELQNKNSNTVSLTGLSIRFIDPFAQQINLDGYILGDGFIKLDVGNKLNRAGGAFSLSNGSSIQLINYGNTTNVGYKVTGAPGYGQVSARIESFNGQTWKITNNATPNRDNSPEHPTPTIISPVPGAIQQTSKVTFSWQPINGVGLYSLSVSNDPNFLQASKLDSNGIPYLPSSTTRTYTMEEGIYYWRVGAYQMSDTGTLWSDVYKITVENAAPSVAFAHPSPADGSYVTGDFDVSVTAYDSTKLDFVNVNLVDDNSPESSERLKAGCNYTNLDIYHLTRTCRMQLPADLPDGVYTLKIDAKDEAGINAVSQSRTIHIDRTKPVTSALIRPSDSLVTQGNSINHTWTESSADVDHYVFESYDDAEATIRRSSEKILATNLTSQYAEDLTYWWRVKAIDRAGNASDWSELWRITIDNTAPKFSGETKYTILTGKEVALMPNVEEDGITYQWTLGNFNKHILTNRKLNLTNSTLTIGDLPKGEYTVKLVITDQVGNSTDPIEYRITVNTPSSAQPSNSR